MITDSVASMLAPSTVNRGIEIAHRIATKLDRPETFQRYIDDLASHGQRWSPTALASGFAGASLLMTAMSHTDGHPRWAHNSRLYISTVLRERQRPANLFYGWAGVLTAAEYAARAGDTQMAGLITRARQLIGQDVRRQLAVPADSLTMDDFELMGGVAGVYPLLATPESSSDLAFVASCVCGTAIRDSESALHFIGSTDGRSRTPRLVLGMAHGIAGVLAGLSLGPRVNDAVEACAQLGQTMLDQQIDGEYGPIWPRWVGDKEHGERVSWCYGVTGMASAMWAAGDFAGRSDFQQAGIDALLALTTRPRSSWGVRDHGLCHGTIGNAVLLALIGQRAGATPLIELAARLVTETVEAYDDSLPLGYRSHDRRNHAFDDPGFLMGATGVALGLLSIISHADSHWTRALGIGSLRVSPKANS